jgi:hypothetical protein
MIANPVTLISADVMAENKCPRIPPDVLPQNILNISNHRAEPIIPNIKKPIQATTKGKFY